LVVADDEFRDIRRLLDRMDEICRESAEIRARLEDLTRRERLWPENRSAAKLFDRMADVSGRQTPNDNDPTVN
jgi:hypothetical protein